MSAADKDRSGQKRGQGDVEPLTEQEWPRMRQLNAIGLRAPLTKAEVAKDKAEEVAPLVEQKRPRTSQFNATGFRLLSIADRESNCLGQGRGGRCKAGKAEVIKNRGGSTPLVSEQR